MEEIDGGRGGKSRRRGRGGGKNGERKEREIERGIREGERRKLHTLRSRRERVCLSPVVPRKRRRRRLVHTISLVVCGERNQDTISGHRLLSSGHRH